MGAGRSQAAAGEGIAAVDERGAPLAVPERTGMGGMGTPFASEFEQATTAAVRCTKNTKEFVNESEGILNRFTRSLTQIKLKRFPDERQMLETQTTQDREQVVHFLHDCVRNRFLARRKVKAAKEQLIEASPAWATSWQDHVAKCALCRTVDLEPDVRAPPPPPPVLPPPIVLAWGKRPIPFCMELLALTAAYLPFIAWLLRQASCIQRWIIFILGLLCVLLWAINEYLRRRPGAHDRWMAKFIVGSYEVFERERPLPCLWAPSRRQLHFDEPEPAAAGQDGSSPPTDSREVVPRSCQTFGRWFRRPASGKAARVELRASQEAGEQAAFSLIAPGWPSALPVELQAQGILSATGQRLPSGDATFDGSCIIFSAGEVWQKMGSWRWDWMYKFALSWVLLAALTSLGTLFPPGLDTECFEGIALTARLPLRAEFLLDASGSIDDEEWKSEKRAAIAIMEAFLDVYGSGSGGVNVGVVQFSSQASKEIDMTDDVQSVINRLPAVTQDVGGTVFSNALRECEKQMSAYTKAGKDTFDVCVLITDGMNEDGDQTTGIVPVDTAIFGIYVGNNHDAADLLRALSTCGAANHDPGCHFFASASDFGKLKVIARQVAENVKKGADAAGGVPVAEEPLPEWLPFLVAGIVPFVIWWIYLLLPERSVAPPALPEWPPPPPPAREVRAPVRLRAAGANEGRTLVSEEEMATRARRASGAARSS